MMAAVQVHGAIVIAFDLGELISAGVALEDGMDMGAESGEISTGGEIEEGIGEDGMGPFGICSCGIWICVGTSIGTAIGANTGTGTGEAIGEGRGSGGVTGAG